MASIESEPIRGFSTRRAVHQSREVPRLVGEETEADGKHRVNENHDPNDIHTWEISQHEFLRIHTPPEVYQYPEYDYDAFVEAIRQAMRNEMKP